jgi:ribosomal protein S21
MATVLRAQGKSASGNKRRILWYAFLIYVPIAAQIDSVVAVVGRSVPVANGDVETAYKRLGRILSMNTVVRELRAGERHEKVGPKRRRLRSERWRRRFAHEVRSNDFPIGALPQHFLCMHE